MAARRAGAALARLLAPHCKKPSCSPGPCAAIDWPALPPPAGAIAAAALGLADARGAPAGRRRLWWGGSGERGERDGGGGGAPDPPRRPVPRALGAHRWMDEYAWMEGMGTDFLAHMEAETAHADAYFSGPALPTVGRLRGELAAALRAGGQEAALPPPERCGGHWYWVEPPALGDGGVPRYMRRAAAAAGGQSGKSGGGAAPQPPAAAPMLCGDMVEADAEAVEDELGFTPGARRPAGLPTHATRLVARQPPAPAAACRPGARRRRSA